MCQLDNYSARQSFRSQNPSNLHYEKVLFYCRCLYCINTYFEFCSFLYRKFDCSFTQQFTLISQNHRYSSRTFRVRFVCHILIACPSTTQKGLQRLVSVAILFNLFICFLAQFFLQNLVVLFSESSDDHPQN